MKERLLPRKPAVLSELIQRRLGMYALAAGAAGVSTLALVPAAEAKIIYTPAHIKVTYSGVPLDLNHDGMVDFFLWRFNRSVSMTTLSACQYLGHSKSGMFCTHSSRMTNAIRVINSSREFAAALKYGAKIQNDGKFLLDSAYMGKVFDPGGTTTAFWTGPWVNGGKGVKNRYLGIRFKIKARVHFGWARLNVSTAGNKIAATLTGYAYETVPSKAIIAGKTKGPDVVTMPMDTGTLGHLALGRK